MHSILYSDKQGSTVSDCLEFASLEMFFLTGIVCSPSFKWKGDTNLENFKKRGT